MNRAMRCYRLEDEVPVAPDARRVTGKAAIYR